MIKHTLKTTAAAAMLLCAGAAQAVVQDVAVNGGFETGDFTGWTQFPQSGIQTIVSPGSASDNAVNLFIAPKETAAPGVDNVIKNANLAAGLLTPGAEVTVTWDMRGELTGISGVVFVELFSELSGEGVSKAEIYTGGPIFPLHPTIWIPYTWTTTLGPDVSGGVTLQLKASCGAVIGCGANIEFDNITVTTEVAAVPVPAAVWLFGSGLLGLVGVARRNKAA